MDYQKLLNAIKNIALAQGEIIAKAFQNPDSIKSEFEISKKWESDLDITTNLDRQIEKAFYDKLSKMFPELGFNLEEHSDLNDENREFVCYIDPIDGTKHFAKRDSSFLTLL
ncbi:MAG: hypothetical protein OMM_09471 [Candidatus Magnetoglobus multicellularis str. Araruama]|uniref:Inositol monophosphatase n=1 Tax=Candidatus Magnetoglobus multicellularis str. Araruama TaxID=890399 RepID=A0A1V1P455_9BACT|nr:MAG: hypothetical protein OMM_09471 [Candidatus Magnetoglobus multicellularis str. Araruama]